MSLLRSKKKEKFIHAPLESTLVNMQLTKIQDAVVATTGDLKILKKSGNQLSAAKRKRRIKKFATSVFIIKKSAATRRKKRILTTRGKARPRREKIVKGFVAQSKQPVPSGQLPTRGLINAPLETTSKVKQKFTKFQKQAALSPSRGGLPIPYPPLSPWTQAQINAEQRKSARAGGRESQKGRSNSVDLVYQKQPFPFSKSAQKSNSTAKLRKLAFRRAPKPVSTIYIQSTHNNTLYTLTDSKGKTRNWISAGRCGFKNTRKATSYASQAAAEKVALLAKEYNIKRCVLRIKGMGPGKLSGVRTLHQSGLQISRISESTPLPHNGCRPQKSRRI